MPFFGPMNDSLRGMDAIELSSLEEAAFLLLGARACVCVAAFAMAKTKAAKRPNMVLRCLKWASGALWPTGAALQMRPFASGAAAVATLATCELANLTAAAAGVDAVAPAGDDGGACHDHIRPQCLLVLAHTRLSRDQGDSIDVVAAAVAPVAMDDDVAAGSDANENGSSHSSDCQIVSRQSSPK
ncbi:hypothetical protein ACLKA6_012799 [Drosophila palustris]